MKLCPTCSGSPGKRMWLAVGMPHEDKPINVVMCEDPLHDAADRVVPYDETVGDVVAATVEGDITLDDGIQTSNPRRAAEFFKARVTALEAEVARLREALLAIERMVYPEPIVVEKLPAGPGVLADEVGMHGPWHGVRLANGELRGWGRYGGYCIDVSSVGLPMPHAVDLAKMARTALAPAQKDGDRG